MSKKLAVVAIGGNSLIKNKDRQRVEDQYDAAHETCQHIADLAEEGWDIVITHGNGPQVGFILLRSDLAKNQLHEVPLDACDADTQGAIGYHLQQNLQNELARRGKPRPVATIVTQVVVDANDPSFGNPSKPIGPFYNEAEAREAKEQRGWAVVEDSGRGWRRVVPSPMPERIVEFEAVQALIEAGVITIAVGGGGIPVVETSDGLRGVAAVIDKDRAGTLLANNLGAPHLIISTAVEKVSLNFGTPEQQDLDVVTVADAKRYMDEGHFAPGSMKPKMEAAITFLENGGERVIITSPEHLLDAVHGTTGTHITH
jgi:carbamate kinase